MTALNNILVAIDLGEASKRALDHARTLANVFGASLHLLCVVQDPCALPWAPDAQDDVLSKLLAQMQQDARSHLEHLVTDEDRARRRARLITRVGRPAEEILAYAREHSVGLIVMGRDGHGSPMAAARIGSVADAVVREAPCPVLVVPVATT